ncbi:MAG: D-glucuronyl C5-epimerase domain protein [Thermoleophilia bacterium]|nr:D-glucuronyl C5-epimerase domain protein [Thermoleophilia bacterium]
MSSRPRRQLHVASPRPDNVDARHQPIGDFTPGDISSGFHVDLRGVAGSYGPPGEAQGWLDLLVLRRERILPVTVLQLGMGAWQRSIDPADPDRAAWAEVAERVADWAAVDMDGYGRLAHLTPMPHTYDIPAPWFSAMAQALATSLLVRTGHFDDAARAVQSLLDPSLDMITDTEHGPILEEYQASPRPHVLNGWMWGLYGLYDLSCADGADPELRERARVAYEAGVASLDAHLPAYETQRGWSTYDRYPHVIANIASPFYHRLHVSMLRTIARIAPQTEQAASLEHTAGRWEQALARPLTRATAVARKVGFRLVKPRGKAA